jgi:CHAT domain-containing protein/tetratricopeptide (TPR) repeat protein
LYEARLLPEDRTLELTVHASNCEACGSLVADLHSDEGGMELQSNTPEWQENMVRKMTAPAAPNVVEMPKRPARRGLWLAAAAAVIAMVAGGWWLNQRNSPERALQLLADASGENRGFSLRVPGAPYTPYAPTRSGGVLRPTGNAFLDGQRLINDHEALQETDAQWLRAAARSDLLLRDWAAAVDKLKRADELAPNNAGDLGVAWLARADAERDPKDQNEPMYVANAIEALDDAMRLRPDPAFYFNMAIAQEMLPNPMEAIRVWEEYLKLEPAGEWTKEARERLAAVRAMVDRRAKVPPTAEDYILILARQGFREGTTPDPHTIAAQLLAQHKDPWLRDFLAANPSPETRARLGEATTLTLAGTDYEKAQVLWTGLEKEFRSSGNVAGLVFAGFEKAYTQERLVRPEECLLSIHSALPDSTRGNYTWLNFQFQYRLSDCETAIRPSALLYDQNAATQQSAAKAGFGSLTLFGLGLLSYDLRRFGLYREAMRVDSQGLRHYWMGEGDPSRAYQFTVGLSRAATELNKEHLAATLMEAAAALVAGSRTPILEATVRATAGELILEDDRPADAARQLQQSSALFAAQPGSATLSISRNYAEIAMAQVEARSNAALALERLRKAETGETTRNPTALARVWWEQSQMLTQLGRISESSQALDRILSLAPTALRQGSSTLARRIDDAIRLRVDRYLIAGRTRPAFELWTLYYPSLTTVPRHDAAMRLVFADLPSGPVLWDEIRGELSVRRLGATGVGIEQRARRFLRLLSRPDSGVAEIRALAAELYSLLIEPVSSALPSEGATIYITGDATFSKIPFQALRTPSGRWLGDMYSLASSPSIHRNLPPNTPGISSSARFLAAGFGGPSEALGRSFRRLEVEDELRGITRRFPRSTLLPAASALQLKQSLLFAEVFHFSGHAVVTGTDAALLVSSENKGVSEVLWASSLRSQLPHLKLAVLAACSTGRAGDADDDMDAAMSQAFLMGGVPEVIAARWDVDTRASGRFVDAFYGRLQPGGESSLKSFTLALRELRNDPKFTHPYFWAAFELFRS